MWNCQEPVCATLNAWKCMNEFCGCGENRASLLSYAELVALNTHDEVIQKLNEAPTAYYLSLNRAWHIEVQEVPEGEEGSIWVLVDGDGDETVVDFYAYAYVISSPDEEQIPSKTWIENNRPN